MNKRAPPGRRQALGARQQRHIVRLNRERHFSLKRLAAMYGVSHMTIYRIIKRSLDAAPEQEARNGQATGQRKAPDMPPRVYSSYG